VNDFHIAGGITVDATGVVVKSLGHGNTASNGTSLEDLLLHVLLTGDLAELLDTVDHVLVGDEASLTWVAVAADVHGGTELTVVVALGAVDGASLIGDLVVGHPLEGVVSLTTVAAIVFLLAGDDDLGGDVDIGPGGLTGTLNSIRDSRGGGVGPAGTTVLGDVLVADVGNHVHTVDVVPLPGVWEGTGDERGVDAGSGSVGVANAARLVKGDSAAGEREGGDAQKSGDGE